MSRGPSDIYRRALAVWGIEPQARMLQEECGEFVAAVNRVERGRPGAVDAFLEEVADVEIMLEQMRVAFGDERVDRAKDAKIARLRARVEAAEGANG